MPTNTAWVVQECADLTTRVIQRSFVRLSRILEEHRAMDPCSEEYVPRGQSLVLYSTYAARSKRLERMDDHRSTTSDPTEAVQDIVCCTRVVGIVVPVVKRVDAYGAMNPWKIDESFQNEAPLAHGEKILSIASSVRVRHVIGRSSVDG